MASSISPPLDPMSHTRRPPPSIIEVEDSDPLAIRQTPPLNVDYDPILIETDHSHGRHAMDIDSSEPVTAAGQYNVHLLARTHSIPEYTRAGPPFNPSPPPGSSHRWPFGSTFLNHLWVAGSPPLSLAMRMIYRVSIPWITGTCFSSLLQEIKLRQRQQTLHLGANGHVHRSPFIAMCSLLGLSLRSQPSQVYRA